MTENVNIEHQIFSIKEVAARTYLSEHTLRYYEKVGLIASVGRDKNSNYRVYDTRAVRIIEALACLRATGMSIEDMRQYLNNIQLGEAGISEQRLLFEQHVVRLDEQIRQLKARQAYLKSKVDLWRAREDHNLVAEEAAIEALNGKAKKLIRGRRV